MLRSCPLLQNTAYANSLNYGVVGESTNYISANMLTDIIYVLQRKHGNSGSQKLLYDNLGSLAICGVSTDDCHWCLEQHWEDFEDCLVARCAENLKADFIVTRDKEGFTKSLVPAITPAELFELLEGRGFSYRVLELD
jgi:predicted nucleic acid-binding protein